MNIYKLTDTFKQMFPLHLIPQKSTVYHAETGATDAALRVAAWAPSLRLFQTLILHFSVSFPY